MSNGLAALERPYREALALFEMLRRLGFSSEDIFFAAARVVSREQDLTVDAKRIPLQATIVLKTQGKTFTAPCGRVSGTEDEIEARWSEIARSVSSGALPTEEMKKLLDESVFFHYPALLMQAIFGKGIMPPTVPPEHWPS